MSCGYATDRTIRRSVSQPNVCFASGNPRGASEAGLNVFSESVLADLNRQELKVTLIETGEVATEMQSEQDIASINMLDARDVADAIVYAVTRPTHVCIQNVQMFSPKAP